MSHTQALLQSVEAVYDASTDPARWENALGVLGQLVGGRFGTLLLVDDSNSVTEIANGLEPAFLGRMGDLLEHNLWYQRRHLASLNRAVVGTQLASDSELKRTLLYAELLKPMQMLHMCGVAFVDGPDTWGAVNFMRRENEERFGPTEIRLLDLVTPHISRAARIASLMQGLDLYVSGLEAAANQLAHGIVLTDERGRILFANAEAERLLSAGRIRRRRDGRLTGPTQAKGEHVTALLSRLAASREATAVRLIDSGGSGLQIIGVPLPLRRREFATVAPDARSLIFVFDSAASPPPIIEMIMQLYGLTMAERRLAEALLAGETLAQHSERTGLTRNTLKTHLRSLFDKTDTARQSELVRQLTKLCAVLPGR